MNFAKENKIVLICGGVAVLAVVWALVPGIPYCAPALRDDLVTGQMQARYDYINTIRGYEKEPLVLPGMEPQSGIPNADWVTARTKMIQNINAQQHTVEEDARNDNARGRVELDPQGHVVFDGPKDRQMPIPVLPGIASVPEQKLRGYLPKNTNGDSMPFKIQYGQQFRIWTSLLATGNMPVGAASADEDEQYVPPKPDKLKQRFTDKEAARIASLPPGSAGPGGMGGVNSTQSQQAEREFEKQEVMNRAAALHMFVEPGAFQKRGLLTQDVQPVERQVFEALVDTWIQADLVKAIYAVNSQGQPPLWDVGRAPIKRLTRVVIGNNASTRYLTPTTPGGVGGGGTLGAPGAVAGDPGPLFFTGANGQGGAAGTGTPMQGPPVNGGGGDAKPQGVQLPTTENALDYSLGMTGRSAGKTYDVVRVSVVMDMDPAAYPKFLDQFYRQNMGYSQVNFQQRTVDPLERASNGYLYGDGPVIEVELQFECIFFRSWLAPLMPDEVRQALGGTGP